VARASRFGSRVDTVVFGGCVLLSLVARGLPETLREPIASGLRRTVVAPLVSLQTAAESWRSAWLGHASEIAARDSLALRAMQAGSLERENDRLRRLLGLGQALRWGFVPAEALHNRGFGEEFVLTLAAGSRQNVRRFSPVVAPEGLVGMVQTVDPSMSLAIIWAHPDFRVSAMTPDESAFGIVAAHLEGGPERYLMEMRGVPFRSSLKPGTPIVSSGLGGVYPRGIPIGTVLGELQTPQGWARSYLVRPAVLPPNVTSVMVLQPSRGVAGVETVWPTYEIADTVATAAPVSTDSAGRQAAMAEASARRSTIDSLRRDSVTRAARAARAARPDSAVRAAAAAAARRRAADSARAADSLRRADSVPQAVPRPDSARPPRADSAPSDTVPPGAR
jgi:rod shape-determining protein MreC